VIHAFLVPDEDDGKFTTFRSADWSSSLFAGYSTAGRGARSAAASVFAAA
jgi:hypothetical protein